MLALELRVGHRDAVLVERPVYLELFLGERLSALVLERADRDHRQPRVDLDARHRVASAGAEEGFIEVRVRDALAGAGEARAELNPASVHLEIAGHRLAAADP